MNNIHVFCAPKTKNQKKKPVAAEMLNLRLFILSPFEFGYGFRSDRIGIKHINTVGPKSETSGYNTDMNNARCRCRCRCCRSLLLPHSVCVG